MNLSVKTWRHIAFYGVLVAAISVAAPVALLWLFLPPLPYFIMVPIYATGIMVPLLIAVPLSIFGLYMFKLINGTIETLDRYVKFDHLTGLLSRNYFLSLAERARDQGGYFLMIDADRFKRINDTFGHDGGDEALKAIARITQAASGRAGMAGRLGGEEFGIYLPRATREQAAMTAEALGSTIRRHELQLAGTPVPLSVSIGIAEDHAKTAFQQSMKAADTALYAAKSAGRDRYVVADSPLLLSS